MLNLPSAPNAGCLASRRQGTRQQLAAATAAALRLLPGGRAAAAAAAAAAGRRPPNVQTSSHANVQADIAANSTTSSGEYETATETAEEQQQQQSQQQQAEQLLLRIRQKEEEQLRQQQQQQLWRAQQEQKQALSQQQAQQQASARQRQAETQQRLRQQFLEQQPPPAAEPPPVQTLGSAVAALPAFVGGAAESAWHAAVDPPSPEDLQLYARPPLLPAKDFGNLLGGQYPFQYDPVYGLPVVRDVAKYGEVLRDIRQGNVREVLWFFDPGLSDPFAVDGRCLVRYSDERVKQSVLPPADARLGYAMGAHGVKATKLPCEPRHIPAYASWDSGGGGPEPLVAPLGRRAPFIEPDALGERRGPRLGPNFIEEVQAMDDAAREEFITQQQRDVVAAVDRLRRVDDAEWARYKGLAVPEGAEGPAARREGRGPAATEAAAKQSWSDKIIISQDMQVLIYKWVPIIGPVLGSAFVIGLYVAARLLKGDLTDRMKMMDEGEEKRRRTALREARIAFLEEEVPALVARRVELDAIKRKLSEVNKKLGSKFEISETELLSTVDACKALMAEGQDIDTGAASTQAAERILAAEEAEASRLAAAGAEGGETQQSGADALMEMGKLNTARIRKAVDPRIMDVKKRVRQARRNLKRESKVVLSDEIIFFDDVAGNEQAKVELMEVVDFFRKPEKFRASGARPPKGVLLVGPPGNGKTLMARAVAGESGVAFISSSASEFIEMYMGLGAARVRDLFNTARKLSPCIIFIDELDAVGRARRSGQQGGNDERDNTVNQLLTELDGFAAETQGIVVMGATNRKDVLDPALTRPGRFDRSIEVRRPDYQGRLEGIKVHLREKPIAADIDYAELATLTGGMSGAQLAGVCNTACFLASRLGRTEVTQADLVAAVEQAKYGRVYEAGRFISPGRKQRFAVVESGYCLAAALLPAIEPIDYVTILPSIKSPVGRTVLKPNVGRYTTGVWTRAYLEQQLRLMLAGRAAEELVFGRDELSSLHQAKLMLAREIVHKMLHAGMSSHPDFQNLRGLGTTYLDPSMEPNRWTTFITQTDQDQTSSEWIDIDIEMEAKLNSAYDEVKEMLSRNRAALDALTAALLDKEQLQGPAVYTVLEPHLTEADRLAREQAAKEPAFL